jgi:NADH-quinone oxidoreductase subunit E
VSEEARRTPIGTPRRAGAPPAPSHLSAHTLTQARQVIALYPEPRSALIPLCHLAQAQDGWLTPEAMTDIAGLVGVTPTEVLGTASFYDMLHTEPVGSHVVSLCTNIACLLNGAIELLEHAESSLGVNAGGTTADGTVTLEEAECLADCDRAPCVQVNHRFVGAQTPGLQVDPAQVVSERAAMAEAQAGRAAAAEAAKTEGIS